MGILWGMRLLCGVPWQELYIRDAFLVSTVACDGGFEAEKENPMVN